MGGCVSSSDVDPQEKAHSKAIDQAMRNSKMDKDNEIKLLLLGAGESGKSTIFKQMKIIHQNGYTEQEKATYKSIIHSNAITSIKTLVEACDLIDPPVAVGLPLAGHCETVTELDINDTITPDVATTIKELWLSEPIQTVYDRSSEYQLPDSCKYYLDDLDRIASTDFIPTEQDVLRSRVRTTGIVETSWEMNSAIFRMFDVGGQRNERRKWIHCFDSVTAVIFVASLSEYDQCLYEDDTQNRMHEALNLFDQIANSRWFNATAMILFLNKIDLFEVKINKVDLNVCFPDYARDPDATVEDSAINFISNEFLRRKRSNSMGGGDVDDSTVYIHLTCATDTNTIQFVFDAVKDVVIQDNLRASGF